MPRLIFTEEICDFCRVELQTHHAPEVLTMMNEKFNTNITDGQFKAWRDRNKVYSALRDSPFLNKSHIFTVEMENWIRANYRNWLTTDLTKVLNETFHTSYTVQQVQNYARNHKLRSGIKGHPNKHKGEKGYIVPNSQRAWYKKGHAPKNIVSVGTRRIRSHYWATKIGEPNTWKRDHLILWEKYNGPVPKGYKIIFLDNNRDNIVIENLAAINLREQGQINKIRKYKNRELNQAALTLCRIRNRMEEIETK